MSQVLKEDQESPSSSPLITSMCQDKSSNTCPSSTKYKRYLRIHSKPDLSANSKQVMFFQLYKCFMSRVYKVRQAMDIRLQVKEDVMSQT